jgi:hypothetical protein
MCLETKINLNPTTSVWSIGSDETNYDVLKKISLNLPLLIQIIFLNTKNKI